QRSAVLLRLRGQNQRHHQHHPASLLHVQSNSSLFTWDRPPACHCGPMSKFSAPLIPPIPGPPEALASNGSTPATTTIAVASEGSAPLVEEMIRASPGFSSASVSAGIRSSTCWKSIPPRGPRGPPPPCPPCPPPCHCAGGPPCPGWPCAAGGPPPFAAICRRRAIIIAMPS